MLRQPNLNLSKAKRGMTQHKILEPTLGEMGTHGEEEEGSNNERLVIYRQINK